MAKEENVGCSNNCQQQWKLSSFGLNHHQPRDFVTFQRGHPTVFIVWATTWALFHVTVLGLQPYFFREVLPNWIWFIFLTNWSYTVLAIYCITESVVAIYVNVRRKDIINGDSDASPWYLKLQWVLYYLSTTSAIVVTLLSIVTTDKEVGANNILKHFINSAFVLVNLLLTRKPYRILHFYIPFAYSVVFILFSLVYQIGFNQNAIYSALDWNSVPKVFIYALGIPLIFIPLLTVLLHTVTFIRDTIWRQCEDKSRQNSTQSC